MFGWSPCGLFPSFFDMFVVLVWYMFRQWHLWDYFVILRKTFYFFFICFTYRQQFLIPLLLPYPDFVCTPFPIYHLSTSSSPFRKWPASHVCQQNVAHQVKAGPSSSSCIKAGRGNPVWGIVSQKPAQVLGTSPHSTAQSPTNRPSRTTATHFQSAYVGPM